MQSELFAIVAFEQARMAQALADYLTTQGIKSDVKVKDQEHIVVIYQQAQIAQAQQIAHEFIANPNQDKYLQASWHRNETANLKYGKGQNFLSTIINVGQVTLAVLICIIVLQLLMVFGFARELISALHFPMEVNSLDLNEIYRLWSPALLHGDWAHLVFNAFWWWWLAQRVEAEDSSLRLINISLMTGLFGHLAQYFMLGPNFFGLSGVIYGLVAYVWLTGKWQHTIAYQIPNSLIYMLVGWMLLGFTDLLWVNMANWAHLGGFVAGSLIAAYYAFIVKRVK